MKFHRLPVFLVAPIMSIFFAGNSLFASYPCTTTYTSCVAGYYLGSGTCTLCQAGYYCVGGTTTRQACSGATQYQDSTGQSACKNVSAGYYKSSNSVQALCPSGYQSGAAATSQNNCKPANCSAGAYWNGSGTTCATCPAGNYCTGVSTVTYGTRTTTTGLSSCVTTESGWTTGTQSGNIAATSCTETKTGSAISSYCNGGSLTKNAASASAWNASATITTSLSSVAGSYVDGQTCSLCTTGGYYCTGGTNSTQAFCPAGYQSGAVATSQNDCKPANCSAGAYWNGTSTACTTCPAGNYCTGVSTVTYGSRTTTSGIASCATPESGWTMGTQTGIIDSTLCTETKTGSAITPYCSGGTISKRADGPSTWNPAATIISPLSAIAGGYVYEQGCYRCWTGSYTTSAGTQTSCTACGNGTTTSGPGQTSCNATCYNNNSYVSGWADTSWNATDNTVTNYCTISNCSSCTELTNNTCVIKQYNLSFNSNGGTGSMNSTTCTCGQPCTLPSNAFTKTDYIFWGWATSSSGQETYGNKCSVSITQDTTLYAKWYGYAPKLHIGDTEIKLSPSQKTFPSIGIKQENGKIYWGNLTSTPISGAAKIKDSSGSTYWMTGDTSEPIQSCGI